MRILPLLQSDGSGKTGGWEGIRQIVKPITFQILCYNDEYLNHIIMTVVVAIVAVLCNI